ncbi:hypothetical protein LCGC14_2812860, partial [marine sediment metagenome]
MEEKIYIIGHKQPDTDSICAPIAYAQYLKQKGKNAVAVKSGEINPETKYVLDYFETEVPETLTDATKKTIILLDHNEKTQSLDNIDKAEIIEVIDHHKIDFQCTSPIYFHNEPIGSTSTIIAKKYFDDKDVNLRCIEIVKDPLGEILTRIEKKKDFIMNLDEDDVLAYFAVNNVSVSHNIIDSYQLRQVKFNILNILKRIIKSIKSKFPNLLPTVKNMHIDASNSFDLLLIFPLKEEFKVFKEICKIQDTITKEGLTYYILELPNSNLSGIAVVLHEMGPTRAGQITEKSLHLFNIRLVVLIGIAGALDEDLKLGDIVVANEVNEFLASSKVEDEGESFKFIYSGEHWRQKFSIDRCIKSFDINYEILFQEWQNTVIQYVEDLI